MKLFSGSSHPQLAADIAGELDVELGHVERKKFSNGERYIRYEESVRGQDVFIVQTGTGEPDSNIMEACLMTQAAKLGLAESVHLVMPNFPYGRQDRVSRPREPISAKMVFDMLGSAGVDHVITLNPHAEQIQGFAPMPVDVLYATNLFAEDIRERDLRNPVIVAPDVGGAKAAKILADKLKAEVAILHKSRPEQQRAEVMSIVGNVACKTAIFYDDMIDTGGTISAGKSALVEAGANREVYVVAAHGIFSGNAGPNMRNANFHEVMVTDSVPPREDLLPNMRVKRIAPMMAKVIDHVVKGESVTADFS